MQATGRIDNKLHCATEDARQSLVTLRQLYEALRSCNRVISEAKSVDWLLKRICEIVVNCDNLNLVCVGQVDFETNTLLPLCVCSSQHLHASNALKNYEHCPTDLLFVAAYEAKSSIWINDFDTLSHSDSWRMNAAENGWASYAMIPILAPNDDKKVLVVYSKARNAFTSDVQNFLQGIVYDIAFALESTDRRLSHEQAKRDIDYLGKFDPLTELPNRSYFQDKTEEFIRLFGRSETTFAMIFLDLDHFKDVNDSLGHFAGDQLLRTVSTRLKSCVRQDDFVARFGGDEFVFLLRDVDATKASKIVLKMLSSVSQVVHIEATEIHSTCSIGVSIFPTDGDDMATLYRNADAAMYQAKQAGRNRFCYFTAQMQAQSVRHIKLASALRHALERNQFSLCYQAQVSIEEGRIVGAEALLRWNHPELGSVSPQEFIPVCEEVGLIGEIGEWVIRQAARHANIWIAKGLGPIVVSVNLSAAQFHAQDLPMIVSTILAEEGLSPEYLEFELTESLAMNDPVTAILTMDAFAQKGLKMSIDDFGTGYSSLSYLKKFKVSKLKIDKSFVQDIADKTEDGAIVRAIIQMASSLGMMTIAEGVETHEQLTFLYENGCAEFQGYLVNKPMPPEEFEQFLRSSIHAWSNWKPACAGV